MRPIEEYIGNSWRNKMKDRSSIELSKQVIGGVTALLLFVAICTSVVFSQEHRSGPSDRAELEAFMDGLIGAQLGAYDIAGATVSVVKDGSVFFREGIWVCRYW